jgi:Tfp pilus assembly protein PilX
MKFTSLTKHNKGYTLLFAVIVSVLVLSIATFILSVSRKQLILSSSARDSVYAFYAADSGLECALLNLDALAISTTLTSITCGGVDQPVIQFGNESSGMATFQMFTGAYSGATQKTQSGAASCAITQVTYMVIPGIGIDATSTRTVVESRGYNIGWDGTTCSVKGPRKVERALRYSQVN